MRPCRWTVPVTLSFATAVILAFFFRTEGWGDFAAITAITLILTITQTLYWALVCGGFRR